MRYSWLLVAVMFCAALPAQVSDSNPFATNAKFSVADDKADVQPQIRANFSLGWDVDLTTRVFAKAAEGK